MKRLENIKLIASASPPKSLATVDHLASAKTDTRWSIGQLFGTWSNIKDQLGSATPQENI